MSFKTRGLVFATFFLNCIVVGLLVSSLTTNHWIEANAKVALANNTGTSEKSNGQINFGLFSGNKSLNVGYGTRRNPIDGNYFLLFLL